MQQSEISALIRNYRAYRYAVRQYEKHNPYPSAGVANYDAMPGGSGAPELFFDRVGKAADMGNTSLADAMDYQAYKSAVEAIEGAMDILNENERYVVRMKWMEDVTLFKIADNRNCDEKTIRRLHKRAMNHMHTALRFYEMPRITTDFLGSGHTKYKKKEQEIF